MILSDIEIKREIDAGRISIDPRPIEEQFTTSAVDLRLSDELIRPKTRKEIQNGEPPGVRHDMSIDAESIDVVEWLRRYGEQVTKENDGAFVLEPQQFVVGRTLEMIGLPRDIAARVEGRSTLARIGLTVHMTAPTIHAGFSGRITLEICNFGPLPLRLKPGLPVCQLIFERVGRAAEGPVRTKWLDQERVR